MQGQRALQGSVSASGAKNAALPLMTACLLASGTSRLRNLPMLADVKTMAKLLRHIGAQVELANSCDIVGPDTPELDAPYELVKTMRASILVLGPLLARFGKVRVSLPGGCAIGARPIDMHLSGLEKMGANIVLEHGYVTADCKRLHGAEISFDVPTVTGTENIMMAACLAEGTTVLRNAAREPEIVDLAMALRKMGAHITGDGTSTIEIEGVTHLQPLDHDILPDRIETGTLMVAAAITGGDITIHNARPNDVAPITEVLVYCGANVEGLENGIRVIGSDDIQCFDITTRPHPGFPTDMQAQCIALATQAVGRSTVCETIFENRFMHVPELQRMGANIDIAGNLATIKGKTELSGATVMATDLRASASLVLAALVAKGTTEILRVYHLDRGYEKIEEKLTKLGASIHRESA